MSILSRRAAIAGGAGTLMVEAVAQAQGVAMPPGTGAPQDDPRTRIPAARNRAVEAENPDMLAPPSTDHGTLPNLRFSYAETHRRIEAGGWTREITTREPPISVSMAGVNMRLRAGGVREMHWHKEAEWSFMLKGQARITAVDQNGDFFIDDVGEAASGTFPRASRIPFRASAMMAASSCWFSTIAALPRTAPSW
jgi:oxalate decarboxylase